MGKGKNAPRGSVKVSGPNTIRTGDKGAAPATRNKKKASKPN